LRHDIVTPIFLIVLYSLANKASATILRHPAYHKR